MELAQPYFFLCVFEKENVISKGKLPLFIAYSYTLRRGLKASNKVHKDERRSYGPG